jgi:small conductance mechanosensitive channel
MSDLLKGFLDELLGSTQVSALEGLGKLGAQLLVTILILAASFVAASWVRNLVLRLFKRNKGDLGLAILLGRFCYFAVLFIGLLLVLPIFGLNATAFVAALGVLGLAVSLAIQDVLKSVFAGVYLLIERPFRPGDTIKVRDFVGVVQTVDLRTTTLRNDGDVVYIPNAILLGEVLVNRSLQSAMIDETDE